MSSRRTLILLGAIALGVLAAFALFNYISGIEDEANKEAELVPVFQAQQPIPRGTTGSDAEAQNLIAEDKIPREFKPTTAITTLDEITDKVALFDIPASIPITAEMFVSPSEVTVSFRERINDPTHVAIAINASGVRAVGDFLVPGDEVLMWVKADVRNLDEIVEQAAIPPGELALVDEQPALLLYQSVHILAIGGATELAPGEAATAAEGEAAPAPTGGLITIVVPAQAAQLIASQQEGSFYLGLVPTKYVPTPLTPPEVVVQDLPGYDPAQLTPYGPEGFKEE